MMTFPTVKSLKCLGTIGLILGGIFIQSGTAHADDFWSTFGGTFLGNLGSNLVQRAIFPSQNNQQPLTPQQEYHRGYTDGINHVKYDNPQSSNEYDIGFQRGTEKFANTSEQSQQNYYQQPYPVYYQQPKPIYYQKSNRYITNY